MKVECEWCKNEFEPGEETDDIEGSKSFSNGGHSLPEAGYFCSNDCLDQFTKWKLEQLDNNE